MSARAGAVLLIGLDAAAAEVAGRAVEELGIGVRVEPSLSGGLRALAEAAWDATVLSLSAAGSGLDVATRVRDHAHTGALLLVTDSPSPTVAMEAMALGAVELLALPLDAYRLGAALRSAVASASGIPLPAIANEESADELVGTSPALLDVYKAVGRVAASTATVLVTGESGTGKELVARAVHRGSPRARAPFVAVNCAAIPEDLLESELFGHEKGAFTGAVARKVGRWERAQGGTLFLDEIGDMSLVLQAKILRALQEREIERLGGEERIRVDVRVVAATHRDLGERIASRDFREDLYYRLAVVRLELPPLRDRASDIAPLALRFTAEFAREYARPLRAIAPETIEKLHTHRWPGNVRELRNALERAVLACTGETLLPEHVELDRADTAPGLEPARLPGYSPRLSMAEVEALHLRQVLDLCGGQIGQAAEILQVHRNTVSRKAREYGLLEV